MMNKFIMKLRLIQIVRKAYQLKWFKISKFRRDFYFELYRVGAYENLHMCLYDLTGESPYNDRGRAWYFHSDGKWNKDGIGYDIKKAKQKTKLNKREKVK